MRRYRPRALAWVLAVALGFCFIPEGVAARGDGAAEASRLMGDIERDLKRRPAAAPRARVDAGRLLARGRAESSGGRYATALDALHAALELEKESASQPGLTPEIQLLLGEVYLAVDQPYSAYRHLSAVVEHAEEPGWSTVAPRAVARLVDAAFATQNPELLPRLGDVLDRLAGSEPTDELAYARAKLAFALGRYREARELVSSLAPKGLTYKRSLYLKGAALAKEAGGSKQGYEQAIAEFERAVQAPATEDPVSSRRISDLSRLAVARLHYEAGAFDKAVQSYTRVDKDSPVFSEALFELSWAYVKQGDFTRAEQTLAALSVLDPGLIDGADAALLRADMLLRSGHFREAERLYSATYERYEPLRRDLDDFLARHAAVSDYYARLVDVDSPLGQELSDALIDLVREEAREIRLFAVVDEIARSRQLLKDGRRIGDLTRATLTGPAGTRLFPELAARLEKLILHENQLARARLFLARALDRVAGGASGELGAVRRERRALMEQVAALPTSKSELAARETNAQLAWIALGQALKRLEVEAEHTQALCNGLRRVLADAEAERISLSEEAKRRHREDLARGERDLERFRTVIAELRQQVEYGKVRQGLGDEKSAADRKAGARFGSLVEQELKLVAAGRDQSGKAQRFAADHARLRMQMSAVGATLAKERASFEQELEAESAALAALVHAEYQRFSEQQALLAELERTHGEALGLAAKKSFVAVRDRLIKVVRHAELGMAQKSFEVREERRRRVERLKRQRARETKLIADELREVMGETEEDQ